jgi:HrpA-like RNA helicase
MVSVSTPESLKLTQTRFHQNLRFPQTGLNLYRYAVASALAELCALRALDPATENLTPLGKHLAHMPVDARIGKMLLFGGEVRKKPFYLSTETVLPVN